MLAATPGGLDFGELTIGQTGMLPLLLSNEGAGQMQLSASFSGQNAADFSLGNSVPAVMRPGDEATVLVQFTPSATGPEVATLVLVTDTTQSPMDLSLLGGGVDVRTLVFFPSPVVFTQMEPAGEAAAMVVTATNRSAGPLTVGTLGLLSLAQASGFQLAGLPSLPLSLQPDAGFQFQVHYTASDGGGGGVDQITASFLGSDGGVDPLTAGDLLLCGTCST